MFKIVYQSRETGAIGIMERNTVFMSGKSAEWVKEKFRETWDYGKRDCLLILEVKQVPAF